MNKKKTLVPTIRSSAAEYLTFVAASGENGVEAVYADKVEDSVIRNFRITAKGAKSDSSRQYNLSGIIYAAPQELFNNEVIVQEALDSYQGQQIVNGNYRELMAERLRTQIPSNFRQFKLEAVKHEQ